VQLRQCAEFAAGPHTRCIGDNVPPPQPWQYPLPPPPPPADLPDFDAVREEVARAISTANPAFPPDQFDGVDYYGGLFVRLAWQCANTYRKTDFLGGCNGARIRHEPQTQWPINAALDGALLVLQPIMDSFPSLSWADLIVLAGTVALEQASAANGQVPMPLPFCGGRTDSPQGGDAGSEHLEPPIVGAFDEDILPLMDYVSGMGLSLREFVALMGGHGLGKMHADRTGFSGSWTTTPMVLDTQYYRNILNLVWSEYEVPATGNRQYQAVTADGEAVYALSTDLWLRWEPSLASIAMQYAAEDGESQFKADFAMAWVKLVNSDRFDGPDGNLCEAKTMARQPKLGGAH
jgi:catalase-peroxidase